MNLLNIEKCGEQKEVLALTRAQATKATYPNPRTEKERALEAKGEIERCMMTERWATTEAASTSSRTEAKKNIIRQVLQMEVSVKVQDLLETMPQLRTAILRSVHSMTHTFSYSSSNQLEVPVSPLADPMLLAVNSGRHPAVVEMGILGIILTVQCSRTVLARVARSYGGV